MTAIATGVKTHIGAIGVSAGRHNDCAQSLDHRLQSWLALAADAGIGTGIVPTARPTHTTPDATYAHVPNRRPEERPVGQECGSVVRSRWLPDPENKQQQQ